MKIFPTSLADIYAIIDSLDVIQYASSRNYVDGKVSKLSPYISRGVITLPFIKEKILNRYSLSEANRFIYELCWREYFQRMWHLHSNRIFTDFNNSQTPVNHTQMVDALVNASTGIEAIDTHLLELFDTGYIHNHLRMYIASIACNIAQAHWYMPAQWMYYHLLDGDLASNMLSWQWVAGTFSSKKYYCNQENINRYCHTTQRQTFLDTTYEALTTISIPNELLSHSKIQLTTTLPVAEPLRLDYKKPLLLYTSYSLSPTWRADMDANRVLILEPSHFKKFPVSDKVISFIINLAREINGLQIFVGEIDQLLNQRTFPTIYSKAHPSFVHFPGSKDEPDWMFPSVIPRGSFTSYFKACEKIMNQHS